MFAVTKYFTKMRAIGLYFCKGEDDTELTFKAGDVIEQVKPSQEPGWFSGTLNNKKGLFPGNYVRFESDPPQDTLITKEPSIILDSLPDKRIQSIYRDKFTGTAYSSKSSSLESLNSKPVPPVKPSELKATSNESISGTILSRISALGMEPQYQSSSSLSSQGQTAKSKVKPPLPNRPSTSVHAQFDPIPVVADKKERPPIPRRPPENHDPFADIPISNVSKSVSSSLKLKIPLDKLKLYQQLFDNHDRFKRGFLSSTLIKSIWARSQLDPLILGRIWELLVPASSGPGLDASEFCIGKLH